MTIDASPLSDAKRRRPRSSEDSTVPRLSPRMSSAAKPIDWTWHRFDAFDPNLLHLVLGLRQKIFIVEQNVAYPDIDGRDPSCHHLVGRLGDDVIAYMRIVPEGLFAPGCVSFGRVVVDSRNRRVGIGSELVARGLDQLDAIRGASPIKISSQLYLKDFYTSFGFVPKGTPYVEDQILHIAMIRA